ncbi:uncharacterized protein [Rhodnius prolixus]|uniref:Uncharacterized protein n=2 Tax=Arthropoda TaxID=6656 RepID=T1HRS3_RHOPR
MANISMKLILLIAIVAVLCSMSAGFVDRNSGRRPSGGRTNYPGTPPFNPPNRGLPDAYRNVRFRREVEQAPFQRVNYAPNYAPEEEIVRIARKAQLGTLSYDEEPIEQQYSN